MDADISDTTTHQSNLIDKVGSHWAAQRSSTVPTRTRWWESPSVVRHYNAQICGQPVSGTSQGIISLIKERFGSRLPIKRGISVAGSNGWKERILISAGIVDHFVVTEYSEALIAEGRRMAEAEGLGDKVEFYHGDALARYQHEKFDLVYWDNALHHMPDAASAVSWSQCVLAPGGIFVMNDYVGPTRMQYSDTTLALMSLGRAFLPIEYLRNPHNPTSQLDRVISRCNPDELAEIDPSECADSGSILKALEQFFPDAYTVPTGGAIYGSALNDVLANFNEEDETDSCILNLLLQLDRQLALLGHTTYAFCISQKPFDTE
jgi:SAM-dependent methyltransferase